MNIFISYRRKDQPFAAGRIYTDLSRSFGKKNLFKDVDNIPAGVDFRKLIFEEINKCQIFLTVIGDNWRGQTQEGLYRIFDTEDYIKLEIECALKNDIKVIPVLLGDCEMPRESDIPVEIQGLLRIQAARLRIDPDWERDIQKLIETIKNHERSIIDCQNTRTEDELWINAEKVNMIRRYKAYLEAYPSGKYAEQARLKVELIKNKFVSPTPTEQSDLIQSDNKNKFVRVQGKPFIMGLFGSDNEEPPHKVELTDFNISSTPVTVAEYKIFCLKMNKSMPSPPKWGWIDSHPIVNVTWYEAAAYCEWILGRLPTEAEWEFSAKEGMEKINFLNSSDTFWSKENSNGTTNPVSTKQSNLLGLYDMIGGIYEWCYDFYAKYEQGRKINPRGPIKGLTKVVRGGSFLDSIEKLTPTYRKEQFPDYRSIDLGFRVVKEIIDKS